MLSLPYLIAGRYLLSRHIGEGGFGTVFAGTHILLGGAVAVKVLRLDPETSAEKRAELSARFLDEGRVLTRLRHPNIVAALDLGLLPNDEEGRGAPYLAMEWVQGETLERALAARGKPFSLAEAWQLFEPLADALACAHAAHVVHRDLKPANVMVEPSPGGVGLPRVIDFGIAKIVAPDEDAGGGSTATASPSSPFTARYAAPEQIAQARTGPWTDVHALGLLFVELLTGAPPYAASSNPRMAAIDPRRPSPKSAGLELGALEGVIERSLALLPQDRFAGAGEMLRAARDAATSLGLPVSQERQYSRFPALLADAQAPPSPRPTPASHEGTERDTTGARGGDLPRATALPAKAEALTAQPTPTTSPRGRPGSRLRTSALVVVAIAVVGVGAALGGVAVERQRRPALASASAPVAPPTAVAVTDLPVPVTSSEVARAAYAEGLEAERQGNNGALRVAMRNATKADPQMAAAWLRLSLVDFFTADSEGARKALVSVAPLEAKLDEHDRLLEGAANALILSDPPRWAAFVSQLESAVKRFPQDAELADLRAYGLYRLGRLAEAKDAFAETMRLDPRMGDPYLFTAKVQSMQGDFAGALATCDRCEQILPTSSVCRAPRQRLYEQMGDCAGLEREGRAEALRDPGSTGYATVAEALASAGRPKEAVRGALDLWLASIDVEYRPMLELEFSVLLADWSGDFTAAEKLAGQLGVLLRGVASEEEQTVSSFLLASTLAEEGRTEEARRVAERYLERQPMLLAGNRYTAAGLRAAMMPAMLGFARGGMAAGELEVRRDAWAKDWGDHMSGDDRHAIWFPAYAGVAEDAADARRALAVLPAYEPLPLFRPETTWDATEGYVYLLAGDAVRALPLLERGSKVCLGLSDPFGHVVAKLHLGMAREATGDHDGACAAYAEVLAQWGRAKPRSITADSAAQRAKALACPRR